MKAKQEIGAAVTAHSAATSLPFRPTTYADVTSWLSGFPGTLNRSVVQAEVEISPSTTIAGTSLEVIGMVVDPLTVAATTFTTTHGSELVNSTGHGLRTGDGPIRLTNSGGALPAGYAVDTDYYVIENNANSFKLAASRALAFAGTAVAISDDGTGTHTYKGYTQGNTVCERPEWRSMGLLGTAGAFSFVLNKGLLQRFYHSVRCVAYAVVGSLDTGNVTVKFRPVTPIDE